MRIFDIGNSNRRGIWILARDESDAVQIALDMGHIRKIKSARVYDVTERFDGQPGIPDLMESGKVGQLVKQIETYNFSQLIDFFTTGNKPEDKSKWLLIERK